MAALRGVDAARARAARAACGFRRIEAVRGVVHLRAGTLIITPRTAPRTPSPARAASWAQGPVARAREALLACRAAGLARRAALLARRRSRHARARGVRLRARVQDAAPDASDVHTTPSVENTPQRQREVPFSTPLQHTEVPLFDPEQPAAAATASGRARTRKPSLINTCSSPAVRGPRRCPGGTSRGTSPSPARRYAPPTRWRRRARRRTRTTASA
jgi:hypothetical protein